ncbi:hypothetical protein [Nakamurella endophytica]|uniref:Integrase n=1 Tax=Nakamurella endophytica TaxID=1748367 RepID=A0A917TBH5_9ACTN|nr:hypothetical protein [Nakamurella endophytica]GGM16205.1 hypothetical protein GCM10011594_40260 [Nakamurella endophytica]
MNGPTHRDAAADRRADADVGVAAGAAQRVDRYAGEWALFVDWCAATGRVSLPATAETVHAFLLGCPAAPATMTRRLTAIDRHHRDRGVAVPPRSDQVRDLARGRAARPVRQALEPAAVDTALRRLPIDGWTGGWFGRRDRALLVLAAAGIPYRQLARLHVADVSVDGDGCVVATPSVSHVMPVGDDPATCGPCALVRWLRVLDLDATRSTRVLIAALQRRPAVDAASVHVCSQTLAVDPRTAQLPLLPPIDQHGWTPLDRPAPLSRQSLSQLARTAAAGQVTAHKAVAALIQDPSPAEPTTTAAAAVPPLTYDAHRWRRGVDQRIAARSALADLGDTLQHIDARIAELETRTKALLADQDAR